MVTFGATLRGRRKENQDRYLIYSPNIHTMFLAIADGMGGMVGGGIAAQLVIQISNKILSQVCDKLDDNTDLKSILDELFSEAQKIIRDTIIQRPNLSGMGTTLCCILIYKNNYVWGNIGDSRIYKFNENEFTRITKDHTQIEELMANENKQFSIEEMNYFGNFLSRSINGSNAKPDIYPKDSAYQNLKNGEGFLLCSDGLLLNKYGNENELFHKYLIGTETLKDFTENIIAHAYEKGSTDNITCISLLKGQIVRKENDIVKYNFPMEDYTKDTE